MNKLVHVPRQDVANPSTVYQIPILSHQILIFSHQTPIFSQGNCLVILSYLYCTVKYSLSWTAKRSNQSILKEMSPGCSLQGLMLQLKLQYFDYLMQRANSLEKTLMLGKTKGRRRRGRQRMRWLDGITDSMDMGSGSW